MYFYELSQTLKFLGASETKEGDNMSKDGETLERHGELGRFVIRIQRRQHSSWQGSVTHLDKNRTLNFRSMLELVKIIDSTLDEEEQSMRN